MKPVPFADLRETLEDSLAELEISVVYGLSFGHIDKQFTLAMGIQAEQNAKYALFSLLESPYNL